MDDQLYSFAFRGLLTEEALDRAGRKSKMPQSTVTEQAVAKSVALDILDDDLVRRARRMAIVYTVIAVFENSVTTSSQNACWNMRAKAGGRSALARRSERRRKADEKRKLKFVGTPPAVNNCSTTRSSAI